MGCATPDYSGLFFSDVEELVAYALWNEKGVSLFHLVIVILLGEVTEDVTGGTIKDLVCLLVTRIKAPRLPREKFGNTECQTLRSEILADELPFVHKGFRRFGRLDDPSGFHKSLPFFARSVRLVEAAIGFTSPNVQMTLQK